MRKALIGLEPDDESEWSKGPILSLIEKGLITLQWFWALKGLKLSSCKPGLFNYN